MKLKMKKDNGFSLINFILIVLIIVCGVFVYTIVSRDNNVEEEKNIIESKAFDTSTKKNENTKKTENGALAELNVNSTAGDVDSNFENSDDNYKKYFYNQLNSNAKSIYTQVINNYNALKSGTGTITFNENEPGVDKDFQKAWDALMVDNPNIFFIDTSHITLETKSSKKRWGQTNYTYTIMPKQGEKYYINTWNSEEELEKSINEINEKANNILGGAKGSRYDKVKYIHDYLVDNAEYDQTSDANNGNIYGMLINRQAVCEGYSKAFQYLLNLLDIPNIIVYGDGINSNNEKEFHSWNYVQMDDGKWYAVDVTWDDPIIIGNGKITDKIKHEYFLKGSNTFFERHKENSDISGTGENFKYIEISTTDYK